jgi:hypothetical protein
MIRRQSGLGTFGRWPARRDDKYHPPSRIPAPIREHLIHVEVVFENEALIE